MSRYTHITYLDTIGRPAVVLKSSLLTDQHTGIVYVRLLLLVASIILTTRPGCIHSPIEFPPGKTIGSYNRHVWILLVSYAIPTGRHENWLDEDSQEAIKGW